MAEKNPNLKPRPPVVVILGHVDHGKSSLLEAIKDLKITAKESGGITQHIGAYEVEQQGKKITFLDTPGHEAFSVMRSRGARVADIAVLVVAADEGVKPQTKEAISHIQKAGIPMIVALNKIDKPEANPEKVKGELAKVGVLVESLGGNVPSVNTSAKTKQGISDLLDLILLVAEMENLQADFSKLAEGTVIEAYLDSKRGPTATLLVREGFFEKGDILATPSSWGKVRLLEDFQGNSIEKALPSMPVVVVGFEEVPRVGETFRKFLTKEEAENYVEKKERKVAKSQMVFVEEGKSVLNIILKADVLGSLEAIEGMIGNLPQEKIVLRVLKSEVGDINEEDIKLAKAAKAIVVGFRVKFPNTVKKLAERFEIQVATFDIIYELLQGIRKAAESLLAPEEVRVDLGKFETTVLFKTDKNRQIIGGKVLTGEVRKGALVEVERGEEIVGKGKIVNLQKEKKDIEKAGKGEEVGILYEGSVRIKEGDILLVYLQEKRKIIL